MIAADAALDAFINANILFLVAYGFWLVTRAGMQFVGLRHAHDTQLRLLNAMFLAILCAPLIAGVFAWVQRAGLVPGVNVNLSDMVVAYYLNGGLGMNASKFEALIVSRDNMALNLLRGDGFVVRMVVVAFLAGLLIGLVRLGYSILCLWRIVDRSYTWRSFGCVRLRVSENVSVPFSTRGFTAYYIVLPAHMLGTSREMKVALAHELQHIRQGDLAWEVLLECLKPFFYLNPAFRAWKRQVEHLRELSCDQAVLERGRIDIRNYCETLLDICQTSLRRDRAFVLAVPKVTLVTADRTSVFNGRQSFLERRIRAAIDMRPLRRPALVYAILALPMLALLSLTTIAIQSPGDWSQDRLMLSTVVNLERLDEINRLSAFGQVRN